MQVFIELDIPLMRFKVRSPAEAKRLGFDLGRVAAMHPGCQNGSSKLDTGPQPVTVHIKGSI